ncbi:MAG: hypothetical protein RL757_1367 [Bacteroidota bacterium]|jgi:ATP-dependent DNA helicase RecG
MYRNTLDTAIEYLAGVGPAKAELLKTELRIFTFRDLLYHFPFRYIDKTKFEKISNINEETETVLLRGVLRRVETVGEGRVKRLSATFRDETGSIELVWFQQVSWLERVLLVGKEYVAYGRVSEFNGRFSMSHPEMEPVLVENAENIEANRTFDPVYPTTEKLRQRGLDPKGQRKLVQNLLQKLTETDLFELLPDYLVQEFKMMSRWEALQTIHFPKSEEALLRSQNRLKFEELFLLQMRLLQLKNHRKATIRGFQFTKIGDIFNTFYQQQLPFELTNAQKRVLKEIRKDLGIGIQMNRLVQGDVGSGKTIVALLSMLIALDNGFQTCLMAPTEILAQQHFQAITQLCEPIGLKVAFLSGTVKGKKRAELLKRLAENDIDILIGTHALIEDPVVFKNLGLAIIDEQHRFGVAQRASLWKKSLPYPPHILVMTATPIPRTLAMTLYGDLDVSVIDELPPGRKPIKTVHRNENHRLRVIGFMKEEIEKGRQIYIVYPLIEENEKLSLLSLMEGFEAISRDFPTPQYQISILNGQMKAADKDFEMARFVKGETQIMVATTVIEVGVNVPNASVMIIENTERFGLSQLHQLRGRVGRGAEQSFCILMSGFKLSAESKARIKVMCETNDGFKISEADLQLRGPGDIEGTMQSGILNLQIADLAKDQKILELARKKAIAILEEDPHLEKLAHQRLKNYFENQTRTEKKWNRIS